MAAISRWQELFINAGMIEIADAFLLANPNPNPGIDDYQFAWENIPVTPGQYLRLAKQLFDITRPNVPPIPPGGPVPEAPGGIPPGGGRPRPPGPVVP